MKNLRKPALICHWKFKEQKLSKSVDAKTEFVAYSSKLLEKRMRRNCGRLDIANAVYVWSSQASHGSGYYILMDLIVVLQNIVTFAWLGVYVQSYSVCCRYLILTYKL